MNKLQIERYAKQIETYPISIRPGVSTCGVPTRNPSTNARTQKLDEIETSLNIPMMVNKAFESAQIMTL
jgi:adenylyl- and sulfurtransferase ThiI